MKRRLSGNNIRMGVDLFRASRPTVPGRISPATDEEQKQASATGVALGALMIEWADGERSWHVASELLIEEGW